MFASDSDSGKYDGLQVHTRVNHNQQSQRFKHSDISTDEKPDIFAHNSSEDSQNDWIIKSDESSVVCEDVGRCEFSVAFMRNFNTYDDEQDIVIVEGVENDYALRGFYYATDVQSGHVTHIGQSS